jgi:hypothetical protein
MNKEQTDFLNGYVMSKITEYLAVDKERLVKEVAEDLSSLFTGESVAMKHVERSVNQLEQMGFIEINDAGNIAQDDPVDSFQELEEGDSAEN